MAALHRVCLENTLFLPSFPISDMNDLEIEKAAMGPRRWIELCGAFERHYLNDPGTTLCPRSRIIEWDDSMPVDDSESEDDHTIDSKFAILDKGSQLSHTLLLLLIFLITADLEAEDIDLGNAVNDDLALGVDGLMNEVEDSKHMDSDNNEDQLDEESGSEDNSEGVVSLIL